nr:MAG TPA: stabilization protein [Bacteriophage sp.]
MGGTGTCIEYKFVLIPIPSCSVDENLNINTNIEQIPLHTSFYIKKNNTNTDPALLLYELNNINDTYLDDKYINIKNTKGGFDNIAVSSMMRSLKRDEVYRYGIVFYNKYGNRTNVWYIGDIKTPSIFDTFGNAYDAKGKQIGTISGLTYKPTNLTNNNDIFSLQLGLEFTVNIPKELKDYNIVGYEIVRCEKNNSNTRNLYQVVLSKPVRQTLPDGTFSPYYPTGFIST